MQRAALRVHKWGRSQIGLSAAVRPSSVSGWLVGRQVVAVDCTAQKYNYSIALHFFTGHRTVLIPHSSNGCSVSASTSQRQRRRGDRVVNEPFSWR